MVGLVFAALTAIGSFMAICLNIVRHFKRNPSIDVTLADLVTKPQLKEVEHRFERKLIASEDRLTQAVDKLSKQRSDRDGDLFNLIREQGEKESAALSKLTDSNNKEFNDLSKEIGQLTGAVRALERRDK